MRASPLCACHVGFWGGHMSATYTAMPVTGCPPIESPALLLRPASRDCHEICRYSPIKPYVSEYRKRAAFSYTDTPLHREGLVTRGRYVHRSEWQTHPWGNLGSAGLAVLSAAASWQELGQSCGPAAKAGAKLPRSCLEARFSKGFS